MKVSFSALNYRNFFVKSGDHYDDAVSYEYARRIILSIDFGAVLHLIIKRKYRHAARAFIKVQRLIKRRVGALPAMLALT